MCICVSMSYKLHGMLSVCVYLRRLICVCACTLQSICVVCIHVCVFELVCVGRGMVQTHTLGYMYMCVCVSVGFKVPIIVW